ncbi:hypothetical protein BP6252_12140 [Coleophoma cylindrospora]|uniref:WSC domain-containing protein n=1 Tax=Coleophoma cylindrospora TaxID=1849047 RepID=A0A3D8QG90_9HELO|nr:hypothetical protein BP6252_12140 [Coleophoma cylindrospora]
MNAGICQDYCASRQYTIFGLEDSQQCFCGNTLISSIGTATNGQCNSACLGHTTEACGGSYYINIYSTTETSITASSLTPTTVSATSAIKSVGLTSGQIAGISVGCVLFGALVMFGVFMLWLRKRKSSQAGKPTQPVYNTLDQPKAMVSNHGVQKRPFESGAASIHEMPVLTSDYATELPGVPHNEER